MSSHGATILVAGPWSGSLWSSRPASGTDPARSRSHHRERHLDVATGRVRVRAHLVRLLEQLPTGGLVQARELGLDRDLEPVPALTVRPDADVDGHGTVGKRDARAARHQF